MDEQEDYSIKVLDIAPLIMVSLPTVSSFFSTCGCFFEVDDLPPDISLLSLACGWAPGANGSLLVEWQRLQGFRVEDPLGARKGEANRPPEWAQAHLCPVRSPLCSYGSSGDYALCPLHLHDFDDVTFASKMEVLRA
jgi:hypothetical protein